MVPKLILLKKKMQRTFHKHKVWTRSNSSNNLYTTENLNQIDKTKQNYNVTIDEMITLQENH